MEALAPNFRNYKNLANARMKDGRSALAHVVERYRQDMDGTRLSSGEFDTLIRRMNRKDYTPQGINYQVGNLERRRHEAMIKRGVGDSKIMALDSDLYHGTADKTSSQRIPANLLGRVYRLMQTPQRIYEHLSPQHKQHGREFHFVESAGGGKVIKVVLRQKLPTTSLQLVTMGWVSDQYTGAEYEKIW